jgi:hypothetical protein
VIIEGLFAHYRQLTAISVSRVSLIEPPRTVVLSFHLPRNNRPRIFNLKGRSSTATALRYNKSHSAFWQVHSFYISAGIVVASSGRARNPFAHSPTLYVSIAYSHVPCSCYTHAIKLQKYHGHNKLFGPALSLQSIRFFLFMQSSTLI